MSEHTKKDNFRSGFIGIIGAPNAGKSTLLNQILGQKISITSRKPQTTRDRIIGIINRPSSQMVFMDTPGIHKSRNLLNRKIVEKAVLALEDADAVLFIVDTSSRNFSAEKIILEMLQKKNKKVALALNKIDIAEKALVYKCVDTFKPQYDFTAIVPVCAKKGTQTNILLSEIETMLPMGPPMFPEETFTDISEKFMAREIIREKVFRMTGMEIPYSSAVTVDSFAVEKKLMVIHASIHVARNSQKGIIIGKKGAMLTKIGAQARRDIEQMTGLKVLLKLFVKTTKNWIGSEKKLTEFGY